MADWRQIQARIRKAKTAADPLAKLSELYLRTRDAMVAWELGTIYEKNGHTEEAVKWYKNAWERFRRSDWKKKAEESLTRLGAEVPAAPAKEGAGEAAAEEGMEGGEAPRAEYRREHDAEERPEYVMRETQSPSEREESDESPEREAVEAASASGLAQRPAPGQGFAGGDGRGKRRRGRRGGRGRHRRGEGAPGGLPPRSYAETAPSQAPAYKQTSFAGSERPTEIYSPRESSRAAAAPPSAEPPMLPSERAAHGHRDPGLASRMAQLESMLRRLVGSPLHKLDAIDEAPAGPGVFLLSDSDQTGYYYVEACQTLRVGLGNLVRGGTRGNRGGSRGGRSISDSDLKSKLAEHLEINESKVSQYLRDHCVVRWIQLDEEAPHLAHFAIGVLRTPLNAE